MNDDLLERLRNLPPEPLGSPADRRDQVRNRVRRRRVARVGGVTAALCGVVLVAVAAVAVTRGGNAGTQTVGVTSPAASTPPVKATNVPAWSSALSFRPGTDHLPACTECLIPSGNARLLSAKRLEVLTSGASRCPVLPLGQPVLSAHRIDLTMGSLYRSCVLNVRFLHLRLGHRSEHRGRDAADPPGASPSGHRRPAYPGTPTGCLTSRGLPIAAAAPPGSGRAERRSGGGGCGDPEVVRAETARQLLDRHGHPGRFTARRPGDRHPVRHVRVRDRVEDLGRRDDVPRRGSQRQPVQRSAVPGTVQQRLARLVPVPLAAGACFGGGSQGAVSASRALTSCGMSTPAATSSRRSCSARSRPNRFLVGWNCRACRR
jgi:hypothetical protein